MTITGPGGAGKSRLALEAAAGAALERPVQLVGLAPVSDPGFVLTEIARAVGARESAGRSLAQSIADTLHGTRTLLFLDNLEHLAPAAHDVATLLGLTPDLDVLATSRTPLRLSGEHVHPLHTLSMDDACELFVELAAARGVVLRDDAMPSVREICRRLDGLPLAIELVAARLVVLPPASAPGGPRRGPRARDGGPGRPSREAAHASGDDRVELRPPRTEPAGAARRAGGVRGRVHARGRPSGGTGGAGLPPRPRGARGLESRSERRVRRRPPAVDARDGSRGRRRASRGARDLRGAAAVATRSASSSSRPRARSSSRARTRRSGSSASSRTSTTSERPSTGASRPGASRTGCAAPRRFIASGGGEATCPRDGAGSRSGSVSAATSRRSCGRERCGPPPIRLTHRATGTRRYRCSRRRSRCSASADRGARPRSRSPSSGSSRSCRETRSGPSSSARRRSRSRASWETPERCRPPSTTSVRCARPTVTTSGPSPATRRR